jgi:signal transduction histidine kinase
MGELVDTVLRRCAELTAVGPMRLGVLARYLVAVVLIGLATVLRLVIAPQEAGLPYVTYFPAATLAAVVGGIGPALVATLLGAATAVYLFIPPFSSFDLGPEAVASALVFCLDELVVCAAIEAMRHYYRGYADALAQLERAHAAEREARLSAERANHAKSRFLAAASHDLRQPLQALRLFLSVLSGRELPRRKIDEIVENMDVALTGGEELLRSLLDLSTIDAGVVVVRSADIATQELMALVETRNRTVAEAKGLRFRVRVEPGRLLADPVLLGRVLDNLINNAIRYTERGGILVACRGRGGRIVFSVCDTGIGIAPEHQSAIFEEFFQVGNEERDRRKGVGLGLAVVRKTVKLMGFDISVQSRLGRGTRFRIVVPQPLRTEPQPRTPSNQPASA